MRERVEVSDSEIAGAFAIFGDALKRRLVQHGKFSFIGRHEILGIVEEEMHELVEAVRSEGDPRVNAELIDVAVGAIFGVASLMAKARVEKPAVKSPPGIET